MSRLASWFRSAPAKTDDESQAIRAELAAKEAQSLEEAMAGASLVMNDDIDGAEERLKAGDSSYHVLGLGITSFMRAVLGVEKDVMQQTAAKLLESENRAWNDWRRTLKEEKMPGRVYPAGTEYALIYAESQLMSAVVAVMHESLTEGIKGFYKLRKAFGLLDGIVTGDAHKVLSTPTPTEKMPGTFESEPASETSSTTPEDSDLEFVEAKETLSGNDTPNEGQAGTVPDPAEAATRSTEAASSEKPEQLPELHLTTTNSKIATVEHPVDVFIQSGANMCFGLLLLILSLLPPAFSRLLSIVGFRGDRERSVRMLWRSAEADNLNGAISGLILLSYYNGMLSFADVQPAPQDYDEDAIFVGRPEAKCAALLSSMSERYPDSGLWRLEQARMLGIQRRLAEAAKILEVTRESTMRQITALTTFELSMYALFMQDWPLMIKSFMRCMELSGWSHALYYYMAGSAKLEQYRDAFHAEQSDADLIRQLKKKAEDYLRKASSVAGKKKFMARQIPMDVFVMSRVAVFEERAKEYGVDLADAVGMSPAMEMGYIWGSSKKMDGEQTARAMALLQWDRCTANKELVDKMKALQEEQAIYAVSMAALLRVQEKYDEARALLEPILKFDRAKFKGSYMLPTAFYEMGAMSWAECCNRKCWPTEDADAADDRTVRASGTTKAREFCEAKAADTQQWLDKVAKWDAFVLDARLGMRVQTGIEVLSWYRKKMGFK